MINWYWKKHILKFKSSIFQLDDWVLCRIYNKKRTLEKHFNVDEKEVQFSDSEDQKPNIDTLTYPAMAATPAPAVEPPQRMNDYMHFDTSESMPKWHTDSSSSEHVLSSSPQEFVCDKEVESQPKWSDIESYLDTQLNYMDGFQDNLFNSQMQLNDQFPLFPDMFAYMQKPF